MNPRQIDRFGSASGNRRLPLMLLGTVFVILLSAACAPAAPPSPAAAPAEPPVTAKQPADTTPLQQLYEAAREEGQAEIWGTLDQETSRALGEAFNARFPGIALNFFEIQASEFTPRIIQEARVGRVEVDALLLPVTWAMILDEEGLLTHADDWVQLFGELGVTEEDVALGGALTSLYNNGYPLSYNTDLVTPEEAPKSWEDILDPKWRGNILVENRLFTLGYVGGVWGPERVAEFATELAKQQPKYVRGAANLVQGLASGQAAIGVGAHDYTFLNFQKAGAPVAIVATDVVGGDLTGYGVVNGGRHPNAAKLWAGWSTSPEAQEVLEQAEGRGKLTATADNQVIRWYNEHGTRLAITTEAEAELVNDSRSAALKAMGLD